MCFRSSSGDLGLCDFALTLRYHSKCPGGSERAVRVLGRATKELNSAGHIQSFNLIALDSNLEVMASNLIPMASNPIAQ